MRRSNNRIQGDVAFLYERLSRDDDLEGESYSITNQDGICQGYFRRKNILMGVFIFSIPRCH